jgi:Tfp pilus assembly protein PilZ
MKAVPHTPAERALAEASLRGLRIPFIQKASLSHGAHEEELFLVDLGMRGAFAERDAPLPVGERVMLRFALPGNSIALVFACRVAWWHPPDGRLFSKVLPAGVGLEFLEGSEDDYRRLERYLQEYLRREGAARRFHRPWPLSEDGEER